MNRMSRHQMYMEIAKVASRRSTCMRLNVGAVVAYQDRLLSIGYNGAPSGMAHCSGNDCPGKTVCLETVHAEINALKRIPASLESEGLFDLYVTHSPCKRCFLSVRDDRRIGRLFFEAPYRLTDHLVPQQGLAIYRIQPAGYVASWPSQELIDA